jgi:hypothetical protein
MKSFKIHILKYQQKCYDNEELAGVYFGLKETIKVSRSQKIFSPIFFDFD